MPISFDNSYAKLPARFYARVDPTPVAAPKIIKVNHDLAALLGLDPALLDAAMLAGNQVPDGAEPLAQAYSGHQFGHFSPSLGDGRAILLGEVVGTDARRYDIQLKGAGPTPFSRRGDGRAGLGPVLREYLIGEAMHALGIPTTRALAAVTTGQPVYRETAVPGAVLARVAASHIRVGTFQFFASQHDLDAVRTLADYAIARHYPGLEGNYAGFLEAVIARQATLIASWLHVGFIHGVMNTDNMTISGETIDYGPCAFMDSYHPATVFSSIDEAGRYAYGRQPHIAFWNLARLAEALLPLLAEDQEAAIGLAKQAIATFAPHYEAAYLEGMRRKLGLSTAQDGDDELIQALLRHMQEAEADWTLTFRALADAAEGNDAVIAALFGGTDPLDDWLERWRTRLSQEASSVAEAAAVMRQFNPLYIPRNHLVEAAIAAAVQSGDLQPFEKVLDRITRPYDQQPGQDDFAKPPKPEERVLATFCGT